MSDDRFAEDLDRELYAAKRREEAVSAVERLLLQQCETAEAHAKAKRIILGAQSAETIERLAHALAVLTS
jgi:hypothetical protein